MALNFSAAKLLRLTPTKRKSVQNYEKKMT